MAAWLKLMIYPGTKLGRVILIIDIGERHSLQINFGR
jgi:hypothetical protein